MADILCPQCGAEMKLMSFEEAETVWENGLQVKTGRKRKVVSCAKCPRCHTRVLVGDQFDEQFN